MLFDIYIVLKVFFFKSEVNIFIKMHRVRKSFTEGQAKTVFFLTWASENFVLKNC